MRRKDTLSGHFFYYLTMFALGGLILLFIKACGGH